MKESINIENLENKIQTAYQEESGHEMFVVTILEYFTNSKTKESENEVQHAGSQDAETIEITIYNSEDLSPSETEQMNGYIIIDANSNEKLNLVDNLKELSENINNTGDNIPDYPLDEPFDLRVKSQKVNQKILGKVQDEKQWRKNIRKRKAPER
jgi:hypothetical protein